MRKKFPILFGNSRHQHVVTLLFKGGVARKGSGGDASVRVQQLLAFAHSKKEPRVKSEGGDKKEFKKIPMEVLFAFHSDGTLRGFGRQKPGTKGSGSSSNPAVQAGATAGALVALSGSNVPLLPRRSRDGDGDDDGNVFLPSMSKMWCLLLRSKFAGWDRLPCCCCRRRRAAAVLLLCC